MRRMYGSYTFLLRLIVTYKLWSKVESVQIVHMTRKSEREETSKTDREEIHCRLKYTWDQTEGILYEHSLSFILIPICE